MEGYVFCIGLSGFGGMGNRQVWVGSDGLKARGNVGVAF
jgi:hypothetical protein